ncbi:signal transduction histidine kinase [Marmoricola sp. URHA0025 HA25]
MYAPRTTGWARPVVTGLAVVRARIEDSVERYGLAYPWWVPVISIGGQLACVLVALGLRDAFGSPLVLTLALVAVPGVVHVGLQVWTPWWAETAVVLGAGAWLLTDPVAGTGTIDTAPALLALFTAEIVGREGVRTGTLVGLLSVATITGFAQNTALVGGPVHVLDVLLGFAIGCIVRAQMRALAAERAARAGERERATLAERQRIAREIHDLVAHSLSVTLLHITGARHALRDVDDASSGLEVAEVDAALADAEQVGRQAMADIRQTVSTLTEGPSDTRVLPGAGDIGGLVAQMEQAGLHVQYAEEGDPAILAPATGLGLYRIAQESLANIAKHAPDSTARVQLTVRPGQARLSVRNLLPAGDGGPADHCGSGLEGMRARAEQLGATVVAGPDGADWLVDVRVPLHQDNGQLWCGRKLPRILR